MEKMNRAEGKVERVIPRYLGRWDLAPAPQGWRKEGKTVETTRYLLHYFAGFVRSEAAERIGERE